MKLINSIMSQSDVKIILVNPRRAIHRSKPSREFLTRRRQNRKLSQRNYNSKTPENLVADSSNTLKRRNLTMRSSHPTSTFSSDDKKRGERVSLSKIESFDEFSAELLTLATHFY